MTPEKRNGRKPDAPGRSNLGGAAARRRHRPSSPSARVAALVETGRPPPQPHDENQLANWRQTRVSGDAAVDKTKDSALRGCGTAGCCKEDGDTLIERLPLCVCVCACVYEYVCVGGEHIETHMQPEWRTLVLLIVILVIRRNSDEDPEKRIAAQTPLSFGVRRPSWMAILLTYRVPTRRDRARSDE